MNCIWEWEVNKRGEKDGTAATTDSRLESSQRRKDDAEVGNKVKC
jgi:hypothetical protein